MKKLPAILIMMLFFIAGSTLAFEPFGSIIPQKTQSFTDIGVIRPDSIEQAYARELDLGSRKYSIDGRSCSSDPDIPAWTTNAPVCTKNTHNFPYTAEIFDYPVRAGILQRLEVKSGEEKCFTGLTSGKTYSVDFYFCEGTAPSTCSDTDGIDANTKGSVVYNGRIYYDECSSISMVLERTCDSDKTATSQEIRCTSGLTCTDGHCALSSYILHDHKTCIGGNSYWVDSEGVKNDPIAVCTNGCDAATGTCSAAPTPTPTPQPIGNVEWKVMSHSVDTSISKTAPSYVAKIRVTNNYDKTVAGMLSLEMITADESRTATISPSDMMPFQCGRPEDTQLWVVLAPGISKDYVLTSKLPAGEYVGVEFYAVPACFRDRPTWRGTASNKFFDYNKLKAVGMDATKYSYNDLIDAVDMTKISKNCDACPITSNAADNYDYTACDEGYKHDTYGYCKGDSKIECNCDQRTMKCTMLAYDCTKNGKETCEKSGVSNAPKASCVAAQDTFFCAKSMENMAQYGKDLTAIREDTRTMMRWNELVGTAKTLIGRALCFMTVICPTDVIEDFKIPDEIVKLGEGLANSEDVGKRFANMTNSYGYAWISVEEFNYLNKDGTNFVRVDLSKTECIGEQEKTNAAIAEAMKEYNSTYNKVGLYKAFVNPDDDSKWCIQLEDKTLKESCDIFTAERKDGLFLEELNTIDDIKATELIAWKAQHAISDPDVPVCVYDYGDAQCVEGAECLRARDTKAKGFEDNKQVYDALEEVYPLSYGITSFVTQVFTLAQWDPQEADIEKLGVCVWEERSPVARAKAWLIDTLNLTETEATYVLYGLAIVAIIIIIMLLRR